MPHKVLIIEDQPSLGELFVIFFGKKDCHVILAETGGEGVKLAQEEKPSAVLIDMHLPDTDGMDVLRRIRSFDKEAKVFLYSGLYSEEQEEEARRSGANGFIDKAAGVDAVIDTVISAIGQA
ncbi:MAG: response regulator [Candidatus Omnitrophica bacterium]|nr:response regulator [Candidatus Omnitrophota bacterium]